MRNFRACMLGGLALVVLGLPLTPHETPERVVLDQNELRAVVGGIAAATIGIGFPQSFIASDFAASDSIWNVAGNRCQFGCTSGSEPNKGATNVGFSVGATIAIPTGANEDGPFLEVYNNGQGRARTLANVVSVDAGDFTIYHAALKTQCAGGTSGNGTLCNLDNQCPGGGRCAACDQDGVCNNGVLNLAPCSTRCNGGTRNGKICECVTGCLLDCPGSGATCDAAIENGAQTCYLLGGCGKEFVSGSCIQDCTQTGSIVAGTTGSPYANGPMHSAFFRVTYLAPDNDDADTFPQEVEVNREESIYQVVNRNSGGTNCEGTAE